MTTKNQKKTIPRNADRKVVTWYCWWLNSSSWYGEYTTFYRVSHIRSGSRVSALEKSNVGGRLQSHENLSNLEAAGRGGKEIRQQFSKGFMKVLAVPLDWLMFYDIFCLFDEVEVVWVVKVEFYWVVQVCVCFLMSLLSLEKSIGDVFSLRHLPWFRKPAYITDSRQTINSSKGRSTGVQLRDTPAGRFPSQASAIFQKFKSRPPWKCSFLDPLIPFMRRMQSFFNFCQMK